MDQYCAPTPPSQRRNIRAQRRLTLAEVELAKIAAVGIEEHGRQIVVRVDEGRLHQQCASTFEQCG
jgi:hypothetical protein